MTQRIRATSAEKLSQIMKSKKCNRFTECIFGVNFRVDIILGRQENTSINAQENESCYSDIFLLFLVALFQKRPKAAFSKIKTTRRVALLMSTFSRLAAAGSLKKLASIKASVSSIYFENQYNSSEDSLIYFSYTNIEHSTKTRIQ